MPYAKRMGARGWRRVRIFMLCCSVSAAGKPVLISAIAARMAQLMLCSLMLRQPCEARAPQRAESPKASMRS